MDENAKTEARNYLSAAGFFLIGGYWLLYFLNNLSNGQFTLSAQVTCITVGVGMMIISTLLIVLRGRDMIALLFAMMGFAHLFWSSTDYYLYSSLQICIFILLVSLVTLTSRDRKKWMISIVPIIMFLWSLVDLFINVFAVDLAFNFLIAVIPLYFAFCCASERIQFPGSALLNSDDETDFKASGSVLGYMLFAFALGGFVLFYAVNDPSKLPLATVTALKLTSGALMIYVSILLLAVGKMRFTPVMFLLIGLLLIFTVYCEGYMIVGAGILFIMVGLFAMLRKESRILPGIMLFIFGFSGFISMIAGGILPSIPWLSVILNGIPCLIAIYLAFVVYSQRELPKF